MTGFKKQEPILDITVAARTQTHPCHTDRDLFLIGFLDGTNTYHATPHHNILIPKNFNGFIKPTDA